MTTFRMETECTHVSSTETNKTKVVLEASGTSPCYFRLEMVLRPDEDPGFEVGQEHLLQLVPFQP